jgi:acetyl esterase
VQEPQSPEQSDSDTRVHVWDPEVQAIVDAMAAMPTTSMRERGVTASREMLERIARAPGPDMRSVDSREFAGPHGSVPVRIYIPHSAPTTLAPALVWFHGGGMILGSLDSFDVMARELASATSAVIVNVGYRLAPEFRYPVANDEAYAALRWTHDEAERLHLDRNRIGVGGDSAGGSLAAATALRARDSAGPKIAQQVLVYPGLERARDRPSMREFSDTPFLPVTDIPWMKSLYLGDDESRDEAYGTPALADDLHGLPSAIVVSAHGDPLRDSVEDYARRLQTASVQTALLRYPGVGHGFFMQTQSVSRARAAMSEVGALAAARFAARP